jgi:hypothetical protein
MLLCKSSRDTLVRHTLTGIVDWHDNVKGRNTVVEVPLSLLKVWAEVAKQILETDNRLGPACSTQDPRQCSFDFSDNTIP